MDTTTVISLLGVLLLVAGMVITAFARSRTEMTRAIEKESNDRQVQITAVSAKASLAIDRANELELQMAKEYVSKANLAEALQPIGETVTTGFAHMNERLEWLRSELRSEIKVEAAQRAPRQRTSPTTKGQDR